MMRFEWEAREAIPWSTPNPQPLPASAQKQLFNLINLEDTQTLFDDPFGLKRTQAFIPQPQVNHELTHSFDEIAF